MQKADISFACPDCEFGEMHESEFGHIPYYFVCDSCHSSIAYSRKTYTIMHKRAFNLPPMNQSADQKTVGAVSENSLPLG